ncbi:LiaF transmembrane domain-containing protein [Pedobacter rhodius]|uniref:LiaF-related protein n=1 Tax=Pedobacter rhodius TaxID=3004098 RepID=A0ABT4KTM6_9SPHI|nr:LiaF domain-containing protein [Pedobacter sp. SJ11]MCZ4222281.1 LiaF-related protein [Pedobacter sp. SJ11]
MENSNDNITVNRSGRMLSGLVIVLIGLAFLLNNMGFDIPHWVFSWHTFLIVIGIFVGVRRNFKGAGWLIMILIGAYFTIDDITGIDFDASKYALGVGLVILGGYLIIKPKGSCKSRKRNRFSEGFDADGNVNPIQDKHVNSQDFVEATAVFGASNQVVYSKNFKGGDITVVFGGADINLTQADFLENAVFDITAIFGGVKLIVPPNWIIKTNGTPIFGSIEDKRGHLIPTGEIQKTLIIDGTVMFGGIEIKSF